MALGFWGGVRQYDVERTAAEKERKKFLADQLMKTKEIVLPELIKRMDTRRKKGKAKQQRVDRAQELNFNEQTAVALERSGQLEGVLSRVEDLLKNEKLNPEYIGMLNEYINNKLSNDADKLAAVREGLGGDSYLSEDEQLKGLLASVASTDQSSFNLAIDQLSPTQNKTLTDVNPFNFAPGKGQEISESDKRSVKNRIAESLDSILDIRTVQTGDGEEMYRSFADGDANTLLSKITDKVLQYESSLDYTIGRDTLVSEAIEVMQALSPALQTKTGDPFGTVGSEYSTAWAGTNFEAAFKKNLASDYRTAIDASDIWGDLIVPIVQPNAVPSVVPDEDNNQGPTPN